MKPKRFGIFLSAIWNRYLELGSVRVLKKDLDGCGIVSATKVSRKGNARGSKPFSRGALYNLLSNPIYVGEIRHRNERHPGQHVAIVSRDLWERIQQQLCSRAVRQGEGRKIEAPRSPLAGKLFDESGEPLYVQGAARGQRRYRYYVSRKLVRGAPEDAEHGWRVSAPEIERAVSVAAEGMLSDRVAIAQAVEDAGIASQLPSVLKFGEGWIGRLHSDSETGLALAEIIERLDLSRDGIRVALKIPIFPTEERGGAPPIHLALTNLVPMRLKRRGVEMRMSLRVTQIPPGLIFRCSRR